MDLPPLFANSLITSIYVPVFFVLSGFLIKVQDLDLQKELSKKTKSLLRPFAIVYVFSFTASALLDFIGFKAKHEFEWSNFLSPLYSETFFNGPIWFLLALFWACTIYYFIIKLCKGKEVCVIFVTLCIGIVGFYLHRWKITLPLFFGQGMVASSMLILGSEIKKYIFPFLSRSRWITIGCLIVSLGIYLLFRQRIGFQENCYEGYYTEFLIGVAGGSLTILCLSYLFEKQMVLLSYWGRYSLIVLCLHNFVLIPSTKVTGIFIGDSLLWAISNFIIIYLAFMVIVPLSKKYCPALFNIK